MLQEKFGARYDALEEEKKESFIALVNELMCVYESERGAGIIMCDSEGLGTAELNTVGNPLIVEGLLYAAGAIGQKLSICDTSNMQ